MKMLSVIIAAFILMLGAVASQAMMTLDTISMETGVPVATLQAERMSTGLGLGALEKANLIADASGQSFNMVFGKFHSGEGFGQIAHDFGLNLGRLVSTAHSSGHATMHAHNTHMMNGKNNNVMHGKNNNMMHGMNTMNMGGRNNMNMGDSMGTMHSAGFNGTHTGMSSMSQMSGGHK
jgi:hypothetical protein